MNKIASSVCTKPDNNYLNLSVIEKLTETLTTEDKFSFDISNIQEQKLFFLAKLLVNLDTKKLIVEGAHVYVDSFDKEVFSKELQLFNYILQQMCNYGICSSGWLLVDDYTCKFNKSTNITSVEEIKGTLETQQPDFIEKIHMEGGKEIMEKAKVIIGKFEDSNLLKTKDNNIYLSRKNILLYDGKLGKYSCSLLDAAFTLLKYSKADTIINILPYSAENGLLDEGFSSYPNQQYKVRTILREFTDTSPEIYPRFFNIFFEKGYIKTGKVDMQIGFPNFARKTMRDEELMERTKHKDNEQDYILF